MEAALARLSLHSSKCHIVAAQYMIYWLRADAYERWVHSYLKEKENSDNYHKSSFSSMQCAVSCSSSLKLFFFLFLFFMQTYEKETQLGNYVLRAKSAFVCQSHRVLPSLKTTLTHGLIVGFFDLKHVREP